MSLRGPCDIDTETSLRQLDKGVCSSGETTITSEPVKTLTKIFLFAKINIKAAHETKSDSTALDTS